jgi:hypothetical protein
VLLPLSLVPALLMVWQGAPQTLAAGVTAQPIEGDSQTIALGPVAALETIKHLGIGSTLIDQNFTSDKYFHGRPSATIEPDPKDPAKTIPAPYAADNSGGSNLGPISTVNWPRCKRRSLA